MRRFGFAAEERVANFLRQKGFEIVERNFASKFGEIDIIAKRDGVIHFIEVKASRRYERIERITPAKMRKIFKTIDYYFLCRGVQNDYCVDAAVVREDEIELIENISIM